VRSLIEADGWRYTQRSVTTAIDVDTDVVLADTMGELVTLLGAADVAFIGGSLVPTGGHNMLEAAQWG
jgi:3-deoxy-D-manno-octulosonic-acid transferase